MLDGGRIFLMLGGVEFFFSLFLFLFFGMKFLVDICASVKACYSHTVAVGLLVLWLMSVCCVFVGVL